MWGPGMLICYVNCDSSRKIRYKYLHVYVPLSMYHILLNTAVQKLENLSDLAVETQMNRVSGEHKFQNV